MVNDGGTRLHVCSLRELDHPNIVRFLGACVRPPKMCFVMELCRQSLFKLLHESKTPLSEQKLVDYAVWYWLLNVTPILLRAEAFRSRARTAAGAVTGTPDPQTDIADGLTYLHARRPPLIHRDIKSHNLLISDDDRVRADPSRTCVHQLCVCVVVCPKDTQLASTLPSALRSVQIKLCDFGLVTTRATTAGTPNYMAPELLEDLPFSKAVDVYAFGIVLWELFARKIPFHGWRATDIKEQVREPTVQPPCADALGSLFYVKGCFMLVCLGGGW
jgi:serine/threonine protein kinase